MTTREPTPSLSSFFASSAASLQPAVGWVLLGALLGAWLALQLAQRMGVNARRRVAIRRAARAKRGEDIGEDLLVDAGYEILARQPTLVATGHVDGVAEQYTLRADWLVARDGSRYVADAKTGDWARSVHTRATRRQLLEYVLQYQADGALLVDAEACCIVVLHFDGLAPARRTPSGLRRRGA